MKRRQIFQGIGAAVAMLILILDGKTAVKGAYTGLNLCIKTVIPSLLPFFFLSNLLISSLSEISTRANRSLFINIPRGAEAILLSGFLGGYPVGAQLISSSYKSGKISFEDAAYMLRFCSNAGPSFLFGIAAQFFPGNHYVWILWIIHITSALLVSIVFFKKSTSPSVQQENFPMTLSQALKTSLCIMAVVCGWVILFRIIITFLDKWLFWAVPSSLQALLSGLLELSNGCVLLSTVTDVRARFVICAVILAFGGICVTMQTASVIGDLPLSNYLQGKTLQVIFTLILSVGLMYNSWMHSGCIIVFLLFVLRKMQNNSSNYKVIGV